MMDAEHCTGCGEAGDVCPTGGHCTGRYEPPRFCPSCGRRLAVRVTPTAWSARCRDHGPYITQGDPSHAA